MSGFRLEEVNSFAAPLRAAIDAEVHEIQVMLAPLKREPHAILHSRGKSLFAQVTSAIFLAAFLLSALTSPSVSGYGVPISVPTITSQDSVNMLAPPGAPPGLENRTIGNGDNETDDDKGHGNDADGCDEDNPGLGGPFGCGGGGDGNETDDGDGNETDGDSGHGNDDDGCDEDNPGIGGPPSCDDGGDGNETDGDKGHGNDDDGCDDDNPGQGGPPGCGDDSDGDGNETDDGDGNETDEDGDDSGGGNDTNGGSGSSGGSGSGAGPPIGPTSGDEDNVTPPIPPPFQSAGSPVPPRGPPVPPSWLAFARHPLERGLQDLLEMVAPPFATGAQSSKRPQTPHTSSVFALMQ